MEQLFASPVGRVEIIAGKLLPYLGLGLLQLLLVLAVGTALFDVPIRGGVALLFGAGLLFLVAMLGQGLLISVVAKNQLVATQAGTLSALLPSMLLSGMIFPIENMPAPLQLLSRAIPARYLVHALRGAMLKGNGAAELWPDLVALGLFGVAVLVMFLLVAAPLVQTLLFGFAVNLDVDRVPTVVADADRTAASRAHLRRLLADGTLRRAADVGSAAEGERLLDAGAAAAVVVVPRGFGRDLSAGRAAEIQVLLDGTDTNRSNVAGAAASRYFGEAAERVARERGAGDDPAPGVVVVPRLLYNPELRTAPYLIPGILAMLLVVVTTIVTAMGLARERETGTLEQVLVTPIRPLWLLLGKMIPYVAIGFLDVLLVNAAASWLFDMPLRGSLPALAVGTLLYLCSTLAVGLLISTVSQSQQQSFLGGFLFALPAILLSGVLTAVRSMPQWLQWITVVNPLRWYAELARGVLLRGETFADLWLELAALGAFGVALLGLSVARFRSTVA
jgi:ABC-2 type transport system permease protein